MDKNQFENYLNLAMSTGADFAELYLENLKNKTFSLLDSKLRVSSENYLVISYEYDSMVNENIKLLNKMTNVLKEKANITKKIAIISDELWEKEKKKYVSMLKNKEKYEIIEEPELIINKKVKKEVNNNNIINDFGDIVEVE